MGASFYGIPRESLQEEAIKKGLKLVFPKVNQLFVDIDDEKAMDVFNERLVMLRSLFGCKEEIKVSQSGHPHYHIYVTTERNFTTPERILLQLFLGSDVNHEFLSYREFRNGEDYPVLFFEKADEIQGEHE